MGGFGGLSAILYVLIYAEFRRQDPRGRRLLRVHPRRAGRHPGFRAHSNGTCLPPTTDNLVALAKLPPPVVAFISNSSGQLGGARL